MANTKLGINKKYIIKLSEAEKERLNDITQLKNNTNNREEPGVTNREIKHAAVLLASDMGKTDAEISEMLDVSIPTVERIRKRYIEKEFSTVYTRHVGRPKKFDGKKDDELMKLEAHSSPPDGQSRWTVKSLTDELKKNGLIDNISEETIRLHLKKHDINLRPNIEKTQYAEADSSDV